MELVVSWLRRFEFSRDIDLYTVCHQAYETRHGRELRLLELLSRDPDDGTNIGTMVETLRSIRHYIGRLAAYIRVPKELLEDAHRLRHSHIFERYEVVAVPQPVPATVPEADQQTTIECILGRMTRDRGPHFTEMLNSLSALNGQTELETKIRDKFNGGITPCVHAEVQMLEHFHVNRLGFAAGDKYIACSKPACVACKLYFDGHPARPVALDSHEKIYPNWAPKLLPEGKDDPGFIEQRRLLNVVIRYIGDIALQQIERTLASTVWHPDSLTMITQEDHIIDTSMTTDATESSTDDEGDIAEGYNGAPLYPI